MLQKHVTLCMHTNLWRGSKKVAKEVSAIESDPDFSLGPDIRMCFVASLTRRNQIDVILASATQWPKFSPPKSAYSAPKRGDPHSSPVPRHHLSYTQRWWVFKRFSLDSFSHGGYMYVSLCWLH